MSKKEIHYSNGTSEIVDLTAEEENQLTSDTTNSNERRQAEETARQEKENLKASAKAKLMAGEALTEEEANTIVL
jgi:hypothetical protein